MSSKVGSAGSKSANASSKKSHAIKTQTTTSAKHIENAETTASSHVLFQIDNQSIDLPDDKDSAIIADYVCLMEKSRQLFNSLRFNCKNIILNYRCYFF